MFSNKQLQTFLVCVLCWHISVSVTASTGPNTDSTRQKEHRTTVSPADAAIQLRSFPELEQYLTPEVVSPAGQASWSVAAAAPEFTMEYIQKNYSVSAAIARARDSAAAAIAEIERKGKYTDYLSSDDLLELPIGIKKRMGNSFVTIAVSKADFSPQHANLTVFCKIDLPQSNGQTQRSIFFGADQVKLSNNGLIGRPTLVLLGDFQIPINGGNSMLTLKGGMNMQTGEVQHLTYVKFNCSGIETMGVTAEVLFPRNLLVPLNANGQPDTVGNARVKGGFNVSGLTDWNDLVATNISLTPFAIKGLEKVGFQVQGATLDLSDLRTPNEIVYPAGYPVPSNRPLWRGVYINTLTVTLPKEFKKQGDNTPVSFQANKLLIDNLGVTGLISANNILHMGTASGWDMSVDQIKIELVTNQLRSAGFAGAIALPITQKPNRADSVKTYGLGYQAIFTADQNYMMRVNLKDSLRFDVWSARAKLFPLSALGNCVPLRG